MIRNLHDATAVIRRAVCVFAISSGAACAQAAGDRAMPVHALARSYADALDRTPPACPQIAKVCALIADPAVRDHVGPAEYAWDFNAPERVAAPEEMPRPRPERRLAESTEK